MSPVSPVAASPTTCTDTSAPVGTYAYSVTTVYRTWTATSAPSAHVIVGKATTETALSVTGSPVTYGNEEAVTFTATVSPQISVTPTGTVSVSSGLTDLCSITLPATTCTTAATALDASPTAHPVTASYGGDREYSGSTSVSHGLTVQQDSTTLAVAAVPATVTHGYEGTASLVATVTTGNGEVLPTDTETVTLDAGSTSCVATLVPGGSGGSPPLR